MEALLLIIAVLLVIGVLSRHVRGGTSSLPSQGLFELLVIVAALLLLSGL